MRFTLLLSGCWQIAVLWVLVMANTASLAQTPTWQALASIQQASGNRSEIFESATDAEGNIYVTGIFNGTVRFGSTALTSSGASDLFVAKWSPAANAFEWARRAGGVGNDYPYALAVTSAGVYVAGSFRETATFGTQTVVSAGEDDLFVAKLSQTQFVWTTTAGGPRSDVARGLAVRGSSVYVVGGFVAAARFGSTVLPGGSPNVYPGNLYPYLAKLIDEGARSSVAWADQLGGGTYGSAEAVAVGGTSVYVGGTFDGPAIFGGSVLNSAGSGDAFVAKFTDTGNSHAVAWAQRAGGKNYDLISLLTVSGTTVYAAGQANSTAASFGATTLSNPTGGNHAFVTKLIDEGATSRFGWAQQVQANANEVYVWGLKTNGDRVYVAGSFYATVRFGSHALTSVGSSDVFVAGLIDAGQQADFAWAQRAGGPQRDDCYALTVSGRSVAVGGYVTPVAGFGSFSLAAPVDERLGYLAAFIDVGLPAVAGCDDTYLWGNCPLSAALLPNIITPNGDGLNDRFECQTVPGDSWTLTVYNRWGQEVYQHANYTDEWAALGQPAGVYYYVLHAAANGRQYRGWVEVVK